MKTTLVIVTAILCYRFTTGQDQGGCLGMDTGEPVYIIAGNGGYLTRCYQCGPAFYHVDSVSFHGQRGDPETKWWLETVRIRTPIKEVSCVLKADNGVYVGVDRNGWRVASSENGLFVFVKAKIDEQARFELKRVGDGNCSFRFMYSGKYMKRCNKCVIGERTDDLAFASGSELDDTTMFKVEFVD